LFGWWFHYEAYAPAIFNQAGTIAGASGFVGCGAAVVGSLWRSRQAKNVTTYGSARWAGPRDVRKAGLFTDRGVFLGRTGPRYLRHDGPEHVMAFAQTRSGKRTHVLVKAFAADLATNLVITTDRRSYHLQFAGTARTAMAALSWTYPADALIALRRAASEAEAFQPVASGLAIDQLNFGYTIGGDRSAWRPLRAFDDGRQTFIEFPASIAVGEAPPLFVIGREGATELVNYRLRGRFYIVDGLLESAELPRSQSGQAHP
jgi:P-type conjugative transfer protein TrbG